MHLDFLIGRSCSDLIRHEFSWQFVFGEDCCLIVQCPWRIIAGERIAVAHSDHEQKFGLPEPVDVPKAAISLLADHSITRVQSKTESDDLIIDFDQEIRLELFNDSSGYEAWQLAGPGNIMTVGRNY